MDRRTQGAKMSKYLKLNGVCLALMLSFECIAAPVFAPFDYDASTTTLSGGLNSANFVNSFGGLTPTAGTQFFASGNGNPDFTFNNLGIEMDLGGSIENTTYEVSFNIGWYNAGQDGGVVLSDFDELYIGSGNGVMNWTSTPEPLLINQWYTWSGEFTPALADIGQSWTFSALFDLPPRRDIALDLPASGFAVAPAAVPLPAALWLFGTALIGLFGFARRPG